MSNLSSSVYCGKVPYGASEVISSLKEYFVEVYFFTDFGNELYPFSDLNWIGRSDSAHSTTSVSSETGCAKVFPVSISWELALSFFKTIYYQRFV